MEFNSLEDYKCLDDYLSKNQSITLYFTVQARNLIDIYIVDLFNNSVPELYIHEIERMFGMEINEILIII